MMNKLSAEIIDADLKFAVAKYATSRRMSCFGNAQETISYMDNEQQQAGRGLNLLNLALSKMVLKQFDKRPDDRKKGTTKVSFTFGSLPFCDELIQVNCITYPFIKMAVENGEDFEKKVIIIRPQLCCSKNRNTLRESKSQS